jgi:tetratricopeptide (TPR) repeat protein
MAVLSACAGGPSSSAREDEAKSELLAEFDGLAIEQIIQAGDLAARQGEAERALFIYMQALELEESPDTWYRIGRVHNHLGQKSLAWQAYASALKLDKDHAASHEELGLLYMAVSQPDSAKLHLERAAELDDQRWRSYNALGVMGDARRDYATAIAHYSAALAANPGSAMLLNNLGYSHYLAGNLTDAEKHFRIAMGADKSYKPAVANLGLVQARRRDYESAVRTLEKVLKESQAYNDVGYIAYRNDDLEEAAWLLTEAIRISPTYYETARDNLKQVRQALVDRESSVEPEVYAAPAAPIEPTAPPAELASAPRRIAPGPKALAGPDHREVNTPSLNVRSAGRDGAQVIGYLRLGDRVEVLHEVDEWAFVSFWREIDDREQTGWVSSRYIGNADDVPEPANTAALVEPEA